MFVPSFKILGAVVSEKSFTKKLHTHTHTHALLQKRRKLYTPYIYIIKLLRFPGNRNKTKEILRGTGKKDTKEGFLGCRYMVKTIEFLRTPNKRDTTIEILRYLDE